MTLDARLIVAAACLVMGAAVTPRFGPVLPRLYLKGLAVLLIGYACFGRSVAYLGMPPLYAGELLLVFGMVAAAFSGGLSALWRVPQFWLLAILVSWGIARTAPFVAEYQLDAVRDAMLFGYGTFAVTVAACLVQGSGVAATARQFSRFMRWYVVWVPVAVLVRLALGDSQPRMPGTDVELVAMKLGDAGVHLGGAAALLLALGPAVLGGRTPWIVKRRNVVFWALWALAVACVLGQNRGGFAALVAAIGVVTLLDPEHLRPRLALGLAAAVVVGGVIAVLMVTQGSRTQLAASSQERTLSVSQLAANAASIVGRSSDAALSDTREWRLNWWRDIAHYTFSGPYFWTGKGFGINLADEDGYQVSHDDAKLRSPHNGHLTFLARAGVPGLVLWVSLQVAFGGGLLRRYLAARRAGDLEWARLDLWILGYWVAFLVNASFDVFLEGPQGGIWFWSLFGVGLAALVVQRSAAGQTLARGLAA